MSSKNVWLSETHAQTGALVKMTVLATPAVGGTYKTLTGDDISGLLRHLAGDVVVEGLHLRTQHNRRYKVLFLGVTHSEKSAFPSPVQSSVDLGGRSFMVRLQLITVTLCARLSMSLNKQNKKKKRDVHSI